MISQGYSSAGQQPVACNDAVTHPMACNDAVTQNCFNIARVVQLFIVDSPVCFPADSCHSGWERVALSSTGNIYK